MLFLLQKGRADQIPILFSLLNPFIEWQTSRGRPIRQPNEEEKKSSPFNISALSTKRRWRSNLGLFWVSFGWSFFFPFVQGVDWAIDSVCTRLAAAPRVRIILVRDFGSRVPRESERGKKRRRNGDSQGVRGSGRVPHGRLVADADADAKAPDS